MTAQATPITVSIPREAALHFFSLAGGTYDAIYGRFPSSPGGQWVLNGERYWQLDEALTVALLEIAAPNGTVLAS